MQKPLYKKIPSAIKWVCTMFIVMLFWQLFRFSQIQDVFICIGSMFRPGSLSPVFTWQYFLDTKLLVMMLVGILSATVLGSSRIQALRIKISQKALGFALQEVCLVVLLLLSMIAIVSSTYSPFIYFQY